MEDSELFKTLRAIITYEREVYLLYAETAKKTSHPECRNVLAFASEQSRRHMKSVSKMYGELLESYGILDNETMDTLSFMRDALLSNKIDATDCREILNACVSIETKMAEMYRHVAEEKELELEFLSFGEGGGDQGKTG